MKQETWKSIQQDPIYNKAVVFIRGLLKYNINLDIVNINDWHCNTSPSVYVGGRRYKRLSSYDVELALQSLINDFK